jgi:hypothetical protein
MDVLSFTATLTREPDSSATFIAIPFNILDVWGSHARVAVKGTVNGQAFRSSITPYGGVHYLGINRNFREALGIKAGEVVQVEMMRDLEPRVIEIPPDLQSALDSNPAARVRWQKLSFSHQKEHVQAIEDAKKPETRAKRISTALDMLLGKHHQGS